MRMRAAAEAVVAPMWLSSPRHCLAAAALVLVASATAGTAGKVEDCKQTNDPDLAIRACTEVIRDSPTMKQAYVNRGNRYQDKKQYDLALADYTRAIDLDPKHTVAYYNRGNSYLAKKAHDLAIKDYNKAIELNPQLAVAYINRGISYAAIADYKAAIDDYAKAIALNPDGAAFSSRGHAYLQRKQYELAIPDYTKALELGRQTANNYGNRGISYMETRQYDLAIADFDKAAELNPKSMGHFRSRGVAHFVKGDFLRAATDMMRALELENDAFSMMLRHIARYRLGERGTTELQAQARKLSSKDWPYAALELYLGQRTAKDLLATASSSSERCEAHFHIGESHLLRGDRANAAAALGAAASVCEMHYFEKHAADAELKRLPR